MAFAHGTSATFSIDVSGSPVDISDYVENINADFTRELADIKTIGKSYVERVAGLRICDLSGQAAFDPTVDAALYGAWNNSATSTFSLVVGGVTYSAECWCDSYSVNVSATDAVRQPFTLKATGTINRSA
jgi:hypothetical protein